MRKSPINTYSLKWSCGLHGLLLTCAAIAPLLLQSRPRPTPLVTEFIVVVDENLIEPASDTPSPAPTPDPTPPKPEPIPDPKPPEKLPDLKDVIPIEPPKKKPEPPKDPPKEPPKKPEPFKKGERVTRPADPKQQDFRTLKPVTQKALTQAEIKKLLDAGAKPGTRNQVPQDEASRCYTLITQALYNVWAQPGAGGGNPTAMLEIRLDSTGRIVSYDIRRSSGNAHFDQTVLKAAANCPPIRGLSQAFLKQYDRLNVEFKLQ